MGDGSSNYVDNFIPVAQTIQMRPEKGHVELQKEGTKTDQEQMDAEAQASRIAEEAVAKRMGEPAYGIYRSVLEAIKEVTETKSINELKKTFKEQLESIRSERDAGKIDQNSERLVLLILQTSLEKVWRVNEKDEDIWRIMNKSVGPWTEELEPMKKELADRIAQLSIVKTTTTRKYG